MMGWRMKTNENVDRKCVMAERAKGQLNYPKCYEFVKKEK